MYFLHQLPIDIVAYNSIRARENTNSLSFTIY